MNHIRKRRVRDDGAASLHEQDRTLDADREAAGEVAFAAEHFEEAVVASTARDRSLRAEIIAGSDPFEDGAIVVIEAAHEPRVDHEVDSGFGQQRLHALEVHP